MLLGFGAPLNSSGGVAVNQLSQARSGGIRASVSADNLALVRPGMTYSVMLTTAGVQSRY